MRKILTNIPEFGDIIDRNCLSEERIVHGHHSSP